MVEKEKILETAETSGADIVAVSGLITPSLYQMEEICREMTARKMNIPLFIGGATTSALHTAVKLAPLYDYVFHGADASASAVMAKRYMADREKFISEEHRKQEEIRALYRNREKKDESAPAPVFPPETYLRKEELGTDSMPACEMPLEDVMRYFDWKMFYMICRVRDTGSEMAEELKEEALSRIYAMKAEENLKIMAAMEFFEAWSEDDTVVMEKDAERFRIPMLRQENATVMKNGEKACLSLADFVPRADSGIRSVCGLFAASAESDGGHDLIGQAVLDTLAEAASSMLDDMIGKAVKAEGMTVIKPAAGYPSLADHSLKADILEHLKNREKLGILLSESFGMTPDASICGMIFIHREASYPDIRHIGMEQFADYCRRRGLDEAQGRLLLGHMLD